LCSVKKTPHNALHNGLKNKERDVTGRKGSVITLWIKMSDTNAVDGREIPRKMSKAQDLLSGCLN